MIQQRIDALKKDLFESYLDIEQILQKHIIEIDSYLFLDENKNLEYKIRKIIADSVGVHLNEVVIIGSSKTGYSLSPKKLYNIFDSKYKQTNLKKDKSDIDIAVISFSAFEKLKRTLYDFTDGLSLEWSLNEYYSSEQKPVPINYKFYHYAYKGWFRPDFKPRGFEICENGSFEELKGEIFKLTRRKLGLAIYQDWYYFKNYHLSNLNKLRLSSNTEIL